MQTMWACMHGLPPTRNTTCSPPVTHANVCSHLVAILAIIFHLQLFRCCLIHRTTPSLKGMQSTSPWKQALVIMSLSSLSHSNTWMGQLLVSLVHDLHIVSFHWCLNFSSIVNTVMVIGHPHLLFSAFHLTNMQSTL